VNRTPRNDRSIAGGIRKRYLFDVFSIANDHEQRLVSGYVVEHALAYNELSWEPNMNIEYLAYDHLRITPLPRSQLR